MPFFGKTSGIIIDVYISLERHFTIRIEQFEEMISPIKILNVLPKSGIWNHYLATVSQFDPKSR